MISSFGTARRPSLAARCADSLPHRLSVLGPWRLCTPQSYTQKSFHNIPSLHLQTPPTGTVKVCDNEHLI